MAALISLLGLNGLAFDPLLPLEWFSVIGAVALLTALFGAWGSGLRGLPTALLRILAAAAVVLALLNPQTVEEDKDPLNDIVLVLKDQSDSATIGPRDAVTDAAYQGVIERLKTQDNLEIKTAIIPTGESGTAIMPTLIKTMGDIAPNRFAGVVAITDGQVHGVPEDPKNILPDGVPFHALIVGDDTIRDRRIKAVLAPKYGLVGEQIDFQVQVDDPGHEGERAAIEIKLNGDVQARFYAIIGDKVSIPIDIKRRGRNTVELVVQAADDELTLINNVFISEFSGIRDRLRVLLVTGYPHNGGRAWRNLLKSDPSVDLVQFTILTNPRVKNTNAGQRELSLIAFPTRQLFEEKLNEFDLIIFDQFQQRFTPGRQGRSIPILQPFYLQNIAEYVEDGGALLVAAGPSFASEESLYRSALAAVLPTRPTGDLVEAPFKPELNDKGRRHPITAKFSGREDQDWGEWFRIIDNDVITGDVLMEGPDGEPLLLIEKIVDGRVGMLMSDQAWLWAKGHDGGGPYREIFRRLAHWLMGEPDLDSERLTGRVDGETLHIERRTLNDAPQTVVIENPDGSTETLKLERVSAGVYRGTKSTRGQGAYRLSLGTLSSVAAAGSLNPQEYADLHPTIDILAPLADATGGLIHRMTDTASALPEIRRVRAGRALSGVGNAPNWLGLVAHEQYTVKASNRAPLAPGLLFFGLALLFLSLAWWREGR